MSDDTPTERFDTPTTPMPATSGAPTDGSGAEGAVTTTTERRGILIAIIAVGSAVLLALIVLIIILLSSNGGADDDSAGPQPTPTLTVSESASPEPSETPSETPSSSPSETAAPPAPSGPTFATFVGPNVADCGGESGTTDIEWSWSSADATAAWFGIGTDNAKLQPYESVPTTATYTFVYQCTEASQRYTVTLEDSTGRLTHKTVEIQRL